MKYKLIAVLLAVALLIVSLVFGYIDNMMNGSTDKFPEWYIVSSNYCHDLCDRYVDTNFDPREGLAYCEKYFEIDLNKNGKIHGEAGKLFYSFEPSVCEDRVYCSMIRSCQWGTKKSACLTPEKCKKLMCEFYTNQTGDYKRAESIIKEKMEFGSCDTYDEGISVEDEKRIRSVRPLVLDWIDVFQDVDCSGEDYDDV